MLGPHELSTAGNSRKGLILMQSTHIASGSVVLATADIVRLPVGKFKVKFSAQPDEASTSEEFVIRVPFGESPGRVSTTVSTHDDGNMNYRLLAVFVSAGARGEIVSVNYTLSEFA